MRKPLRLLTLLASLLPMLALAAPTPMRLVESYASTDVINVGANTIGALSTATPGGGQGTLVVSGLSGTVSKAWLYWKGIEFVSPANGFVGGNGTYDEAEIRFDGQLITGTLVAANGNVDCHPSGNNIPFSGAMYRAEVTSFIQARGNGSYAFAGLSDGSESSPNDSDAHSANGLSLLIYFDDGVSTNDRRVDQYEGQLSNTEGTWDFEFPLDYIGGAVDLILHVSDGQQIFAADGETVFTTRPGKRPGTAAIHRLDGDVFADGLPKYAGLSVPTMNRNGGRGAGLWDIRRVPLTMQFTRAARYTTQISQSNIQDCVSLQIAQVLSAPTAEPAMLSPGLHDFGDIVRLTQSPTQRFTLTNLLPHSIRIASPPTLSSNIATSSSNWYSVLAQDCSGQTLIPGASCNIDLACRPPAGAFADSLPSADMTLAWAQVAPSPNYDGTVYAALRCAGVPNAPFARLEFAPRACFLTNTPVNGTAVVPLTVRNTSALPATVTAASVNNRMGESSLSMLSTTCTIGRVIAASEACEMRVLYRARAAPSFNQGSANVGFSSSVDPDVRFISMTLDARTVAVSAVGEAMFQNGFEFGVAQCLE